MNKIIFPLKAGMRSILVADLQDALQMCLAKAAIPIPDEQSRKKISAELKSERDK